MTCEYTCEHIGRRMRTSQTEYWKSDDLYISSFVGYFPADKPKYSCIVVIHKPNKNKGVNRILDDLRKINGSKMLWTGRTGLKRDMLNALNTGHTIGLVMDQKPRKRMGPTVDLLGRKK